MKRNGLSKSRIPSSEECSKKFWLSVHKPEGTEYDECAEMRLAGGSAENPPTAEDTNDRVCRFRSLASILRIC